MLSKTSKLSRQNRIFVWWLFFFSWESPSPEKQRNPYCAVLCSLRVLHLPVLHWQLILKWEEYWCEYFWGGCGGACTGYGIISKLPQSTLVDHISQLRSLTKPIICCWLNSSKSSSSCVYEVFCQRIWCMTVSLVWRWGPTRAWKLFSCFQEGKGGVK